MLSYALNVNLRWNFYNFGFVYAVSNKATPIMFSSYILLFPPSALCIFNLFLGDDFKQRQRSAKSLVCSWETPLDRQGSSNKAWRFEIKDENV